MSIDRWVDKEDVVQVYNGILLRLKKEQIWVSWAQMDEHRACYTEWSSQKEKNKILYITADIWNLEK